ncbi:RNA-directed DNA polymerase (Reverse transcriptase), Ribonuclease H [Gossypium australe]|uniref:RNA-directed DNA polymerase (Reverse transcriptase), Ribonuclease H n=1 Tax=Gossypium australe TaxID=47621 RepID=A0A5B6UW88_9ROSI|nr:RNA-directed DNA polymerase (Reverse transcriptase), Ribonuclease H [Gossypium australe]
MSFGLKNARATYQRAMVTLFYDMMHKEIEDYVDDMLKLNPTKCTFGARSGKLLRFVVSEKGIEIDLEKVKAIQELLNYIARFISQLTEKCDPIFRLLKKHNPGYLSNALVLTPPSLDKPLILYLAVFGNSMGCVFGQHDESGRKEKEIYYLIKKFIECETWYLPIEKLCCALIWTTRRLR